MIKTTPMIFNSEMVRALLAGSKTQTRRIVKPQPNLVDQWFGWIVESTQKKNEGCAGWITEQGDKLYAKPPCNSGDLIYVRETFGFSENHFNDISGQYSIGYKADEAGSLINPTVDNNDYMANLALKKGNTPSIHMPRWASRLRLKINSVRVERIQDISEDDAKKEGIVSGHDGYYDATAQCRFAKKWEEIYFNSWNLKNDWVWVIDFEVIHKNIDQVLEEMEQAA
jgi:hypothetical protein